MTRDVYIFINAAGGAFLTPRLVGDGIVICDVPDTATNSIVLNAFNQTVFAPKGGGGYMQFAELGFGRIATLRQRGYAWSWHPYAILDMRYGLKVDGTGATL